MSSTLTEEQQAFVTAIEEFCQRESGTRQQRDALTENGTQPHNEGLYRRMAELGWIGAGFPEKYGGSGGGITEMCLFAEHTAYGLAPVGGFTTTVIAAGPYLKFGTEQQCERIVGGIVGGAVESIAMSEPEAGSDVAALTCRAEPVDGGFRINGQKTWCSNAHIAEHILLVARSSTEGSKHQGLTMFCVPTDSPGLLVRGIDTMGGREVNDLYFTDCFVPEDAVVGKVDHAWNQLTAGLNAERLILAATMLGRARRALDDALDHVRTRSQFGRPVGTFQALRHRIADLATELECCKLLVRRVAELSDEHPDTQFPREASMAKLKVTETAKQISMEGMQMMGGYGYATEYDMEQHVRATLVSTIYGGTSEVQRDIIGKTYGL